MTTKMRSRKDCKLCGSPINAGLQSNKVNKNPARDAAFFLDKIDCLNLLSKCCVNCFDNIVDSAYELRRDEEYSNDAKKELTARAAAAYAATILKEQTKPKKGKKKDVYTMHPEPWSDREKPMLSLIIDDSGMGRWAVIENKDITRITKKGSWGISFFWKSSSHFRHLRKKYGIKGAVCVEYMKKDYLLDKACAFYFWRQFQEQIKDIERDLRECNQPPIGYTGSAGRYKHVWRGDYRAAHFRMLVPIKQKLKVFKYEMKREAA